MRFVPGVALAIGVAVLGITYAADNLLLWTVVIVAFGALWVMESKRGNPWASHLALVFYMGMAFYGILRGFEPMLMLAAALAIFAAWDLELLLETLRETTEARSANLIMLSHFGPLGIVLSLSIALSLLVRVVQFELSFWWILFIAAIGVVVMTRAVMAFQRESD